MKTIQSESIRIKRIAVDTGHKLNLHKTFRRCPGRLMYLQFTPCVYWDTIEKYTNEKYTNKTNYFP